MPYTFETVKDPFTEEIWDKSLFFIFDYEICL
jgi:hypothetical protein